MDVIYGCSLDPVEKAITQPRPHDWKRHSRNLFLLAGTDVDENGHPVCVKMYDRDEIGKWYTHPCDHQAQYVCEYNRIGHDNPDPPTTMDPTVSLSL